MQSSVDSEGLVDTFMPFGIRVVPTGIELDKRKLVRRVPVNLVARQENEGDVCGVTARSLEQIAVFRATPALA